MNRLTIWFTSDTHGYLFDTNYISRESLDQGLLGFDFPKDGNTLVIDGGDTTQGSPLTNYCLHEGNRLPVMDAMNHLGYDYVTLGNHDFNNGPAWIESYLNGLDARCLCANVQDKQGSLPIAPWVVHVLENGLRIGIVGIVTDWVNVWEKPENLTRLTVTDPMDAAVRAVEALKQQGVDVLVGIYHGGVEEDLKTGRILSDTGENIACQLCRRLPFDLLLTGHQHISIVGKNYHGTHIVQPTNNAVNAVRITMDAEGVFHSELVYPHRSPVLTDAQAAFHDQLERWLDQPIGVFSKPILPGDKLDMALHGTPIADFFNKVQLWASGADISCTALPNELKGFERNVTVRDVVSSYVYSNTLVVMEVSGRILRLALEQCARYFAVDAHGGISISPSFLIPKEEHYNYDYYSGITYSFDLSKPEGERVSRLERAGSPIKDEDIFQLVMSNYRATGAGNFEMFRDCKHIREISLEVSDMIINYIFEKRYITVEEKRSIVS